MAPWLNKSHQVDIPEYLWRALEEVAATRDVKTDRLAAHLLWRCARKLADDPGIPKKVAGGLRLLPRPGQPDTPDAALEWSAYPCSRHAR